MSARGTGSVNDGGYRRISKPGHPNAFSNGTILEHRWVMSEHLGRPLKKWEDVHHKDGNKLNNHIDNLELWIRKQPRGQRASDMLEWAKEIIELYEGRVK